MNFHRPLIKIGVATAGAVALVVLPLVPAYADPLASPDGVAQVANAAIQNVGAEVETSGVSASPDGFNTVTGEVSLPLVGDGEIAVGPKDGDLKISMPTEVDTAPGSAQPDGTVSYPGNGDSAGLVVKAGEGVVQQAMVIPSDRASDRYSFTLDSRLSPRLTSSGGIQLTTTLAQLDPSTEVSDRNEAIEAGFIQPAWAIDAVGNRVPSHYALNGNSFTQIVEFTSATAFPVVADPTYTIFPWGYAIKYSKGQKNMVAAAAESGYPALAAAFCSLIGSVPGALACGVLGGAFILYAGNQAKAARAQGKCLQLNQPFAPIPPAIYVVPC